MHPPPGRWGNNFFTLGGLNVESLGGGRRLFFLEGGGGVVF